MFASIYEKQIHVHIACVAIHVRFAVEDDAADVHDVSGELADAEDERDAEGEDELDSDGG